VQTSGVHRRLYDWVMSWAEHRHGPAALAGLSFAEASFFPVPPDVLLIALGVARPSRAYVLALACTIASVLGGLAGYAIGAGGWEATQGIFFSYVPGFTPDVFARVQGWYDEFGFAAVLIAGFTPIPFKVFTIASGVFGMNVLAFAAASLVSRGLRFFVEAFLIDRYGAQVRAVIERNFNLMTVAFVALVIAGFVAVRMIG
jgi:membrane protein YqaA with SNARE-associated domain